MSGVDSRQTLQISSSSATGTVFREFDKGAEKEKEEDVWGGGGGC
jgi:hypothetical protein